MNIRRMLVPVDGSALSLKAAEVAASLARQSETSVTLLMALEPPEIAREYADPGALEEVRRALWQAAEVMLDQAEGVVRPLTQRVSKLIVWGMPATAIAAEADRGYDLVVMGSRGMGLLPTDRHLLGSVAEWILRRTHCPVLIIPRHPDEETEM
jgi:nucleotide-binding universal stress UspA family protein